MKEFSLRRRVFILAVSSALGLGPLGAATAQAASSSPHQTCPTAEVFATNNTAIITDPADPRLKTRLTGFEHEVKADIRANAAQPGASRLLDGVFWSDDLKQTTYERSREFDVYRVSRDGLHHIAATVAKQYHQESVLTFRCLPRTAPQVNAVELQAPGASATRLHDALLADPEARDTLVGGSVTLDGRLILIAPVADLPLAQKFASSLGIDGTAAQVRYGEDEFVS